MGQFVQDIIYCYVHIVHAVHLEHLHGGVLARTGGEPGSGATYASKSEGVLDEFVDDACFGVYCCCAHMLFGFGLVVVVVLSL